MQIHNPFTDDELQDIFNQARWEKQCLRIHKEKEILTIFTRSIYYNAVTAGVMEVTFKGKGERETLSLPSSEIKFIETFSEGVENGYLTDGSLESYRDDPFLLMHREVLKGSGEA